MWGIVDICCFILGFGIAALIHIGAGNPYSDLIAYRYVLEYGISIVLGLFLLSGFEMYSILLLELRPLVVTIILCTIYNFAGVSLVELILFRDVEDVQFLAIGCVVGNALLFVWRELLYQYHKRSEHRQKMLMIEKLKDDNSRVRRMKYACLSRFDAWYEQVDVNDMAAVTSFIEERFPKYDVICLMESVPHEVRDMFMNAGRQMGKEFYIVPVVYEMNFVKVRLAFLDDVMVFHLMPPTIDPIRMAIKRFMDVVLALIGCVIAAIPMGIIALLIKATSPGPVLYRQKRLTQNKREFYIYKFRSMVQNAEALSGPMLAVKDDPRVTKVGKVLRSMRLDELPQLFNVLKGDMSIVGPRPERPFFVEKYEKEIQNYDDRFMVRSGITALSHVYGRYSTDILDRTLYDILYVQHYSLMLDIKIILLTTRTIFLSDAAEGVWTQDRRVVN